MMCTGEMATTQRRHALRLLQLTLSTLLNLRPPADCRVEADDEGKLAEALFGDVPAPCVPPPVTKVELGAKTREQYAAENKVGCFHNKQGSNNSCVLCCQRSCVKQ